MACKFIMQLSKLRKSSAESVENINEFNYFKKYLHVERQVESELKKILRCINKSQEKCLVLLCGSAGDGKSHLISYLKHADPEGLLDTYELYNDATESSEPTLTSIDTLADKLINFDDDHYDISDGKKMIIAINLGTLNNFIESEKGKYFTKLRDYVTESGILSSYMQEQGYKEQSVFQHISFADYQVFSLTEDGVKTSFLEKILEKVFCKNKDNPFYQAYKEEEDYCNLYKRCPVRHNFEFMLDPNNRKSIINRIIQAVVVEKTIVATRDVFDLIYNLIVRSDFEEKNILVDSSELEYIKYYIKSTTPMLLNDYEDISPLINEMKNYDILKVRSRELDEAATKFHVSSNIEKLFEDATKGTPYAELETISDILNLGMINADLKKIIYRFIARIKAMKDEVYKSEYEHRMEEYLEYVYKQNSGREQELEKLYELTKRAILNWTGNFDNDLVCIDESNEYNWILQELKLKAVFNKDLPKINEEIQRFSPIISLRFTSDRNKTLKPMTIKIDFSLYELILNISQGYIPTLKDKNRYTEFESFVQHLIEDRDKDENEDEKIIILPKNVDKRYKIIFEKNIFGYKFKVEE